MEQMQACSCSDQDCERRSDLVERTSDAAVVVTEQGEPRWKQAFHVDLYRKEHPSP